jgi:hypothetical protein
MSKRAVWLAGAALSLGFVVVSCTGSDGTANFDATAGDGAGGDDGSGAGSSSKAGTSNTGGTMGDAGSTGAAAASSLGGRGSGDAGSGGTGEGGVMSNAGAGGDATLGGAPGGDAGAPGSGAGAPGNEAGAGGAGPEREPCESIKDCEEGELCVKPSCGKVAGEGVCTKAGKSPVCGCDGITYFNGALAISESADVRNQGACKGESATTCEGECKGDNTHCGIVELRGGDCEAKAGGVCWRLPAECPSDDVTLYNLCGSEKCLSLCEAVQEGIHAVPGGLDCAAVSQ